MKKNAFWAVLAAFSFFFAACSKEELNHQNHVQAETTEEGISNRAFGYLPIAPMKVYFIDLAGNEGIKDQVNLWKNHPAAAGGDHYTQVIKSVNELQATLNINEVPNINFSSIDFNRYNMIVTWVSCPYNGPSISKDLLWSLSGTLVYNITVTYGNRVSPSFDSRTQIILVPKMNEWPPFNVNIIYKTVSNPPTPPVSPKPIQFRDIYPAGVIEYDLEWKQTSFVKDYGPKVINSMNDVYASFEINSTNSSYFNGIDFQTKSIIAISLSSLINNPIWEKEIFKKSETEYILNIEEKYPSIVFHSTSRRTLLLEVPKILEGATITPNIKYKDSGLNTGHL